MKKYDALVLFLICIMLAGCNGNTDASKTEQVSLEKLPDDYTVEQAKEDGCVIYENGDITYGQEIWDAFVETVFAQKEASSVRLGFYYTLDEPSRYSPDYYESIKDDYPCLFIQDVNYDGTTYTLRRFDDDNEIVQTYQISCLDTIGVGKQPFFTICLPAGTKIMRAFRIDESKPLKNQLELVARPLGEGNVSIKLTNEQYRSGDQ